MTVANAHQGLPKRRTVVRSIGAIGAALVVGLGLQAGATSAAYVDTAHANSSALIADVGLLPKTGLAMSRTAESSIGIGADGVAYVWGRTDAPNAGSTQGKPWSNPAKVGGLPEDAKFVQISNGALSYNALQDNGHVWGWGENFLADGTGIPRVDMAAVQVRINGPWSSDNPVLDQMVEIVSSKFAGAGIRADGTVWSWGDYNYGGASGIISGAKQVPGLPDPKADGGAKAPVSIFSGESNFWVILADGEIWYWGDRDSLPMADNTGKGTARLSAAFEPWMRNHVGADQPHIVQLGGGERYGFALLSTGEVLTWSDSMNGLGGRPVGKGAHIPAPIPGVTGMVKSQGGPTGALFLTENGSLHGYSLEAGLGSVPEEFSHIADGVVQFSKGSGTSVWMHHDGSVWGQGPQLTKLIGTQGYGPQTLDGFDLGVFL